MTLWRYTCSFKSYSWKTLWKKHLIKILSKCVQFDKTKEIQIYDIYKSLIMKPQNQYLKNCYIYCFFIVHLKKYQCSVIRSYNVPIPTVCAIYLLKSIFPFYFSFFLIEENIEVHLLISNPINTKQSHIRIFIYNFLFY